MEFKIGCHVRVKKTFDQWIKEKGYEVFRLDGEIGVIREFTRDETFGDWASVSIDSVIHAIPLIFLDVVEEEQ